MVVYEEYGQQCKLDVGVYGQRVSMGGGGSRHQSGGMCLGIFLSEMEGRLSGLGMRR
jgi:hypothetical protein